MTGIFKANNPSNTFLLLIYGVLLKLNLFLNPVQPLVQSSDAVLYQSMVIWLQKIFSGFPEIFSIISFVLLFVQAASFNKWVNDQRMMFKPHYLTGMSYLLITSLFTEWFTLSAPLIINTILIWVWSKLCSLHNYNAAKTAIYNIGLVLGIATFIYYPAIVFTILFIVGIAITRPFKLKEWVIGLLGISTAFYFFGAWLFLTNQWQIFHFPLVSISRPAFFESKWALAGIILLGLTMLVGIVFAQNNMRRQIVQTRKSWQLIYLYLLVAAFVPFVYSTSSYASWILMAVPLSLLAASAFFYPEKKWFPQLIHWGMVVISVAVAYFVQ